MFENFNENNLKEVINYQMELNWYKETYEDLKKIEEWYLKFTTTKEKEKEFLKWLKKYLHSIDKKVHKQDIAKVANRIILDYWLKVVYDK